MDLNARTALAKLKEVIGNIESDRNAFDAQLTKISELHALGDASACRECGKPYPCPTVEITG